MGRGGGSTSNIVGERLVELNLEAKTTHILEQQMIKKERDLESVIGRNGRR